MMKQSTFSKNFDRNFFTFLLSIFVGVNLFAQNAIVGTGFTNGWDNGSCNDATNFNHFSLIAGTSYGVTTNAKSVGDSYFRLGVDWGSSKYSVSGGGTAGVTNPVVPNTTYTVNALCDTSGTMRYNVPSTSYNYVFKTSNAGTSVGGNSFVFFEVQGAVQSVSSVSRMPSSTVPTSMPVTINAITSGSLSTGQAVYLRYTTNNWTSSNVIQMAGSGTSYSASIPGQANSTAVSYYVFTSGTANVAGNGSNADLYTINLNNNSGSNYSYTVNAAAAAVWVTSTAGTGSAGVGYNTLGAATTAINTGTAHTGAINVAINSSTTEAGAVVLNSSGAGSASYTSVKIYPTSDNITVSGPTVTGRGLVELNGADNVTIDGDNPNTAGINRNLTFTNTAAATVTYAMGIRIAVDATATLTADNNTIKNCIVNGNATGRNASTNTSSTSSENYSYGIYAGNRNVTTAGTNAPGAIALSTTTIGAGATMANLNIDNNEVNACARAIMVQGSASTVAVGLQITNNTIGSATPNSTTTVYSYGIGVQGTSNGVIRGNIIRSIESYVGTTIRGIDVGYISGNAGDQFTIEKNKVYNIVNRNTSTWGAYGISIFGGTSNIIQNNFIYSLNSVQGNSATSLTYVLKGIRIDYGNNHKIYHNSVYLSGALLGTGTDNSSCLTIAASSYTGIDVRNNIFSNTQTGSTASRILCVQLPSAATSAMSLSLNNNAYYTGSAANNYILGTDTGTYYTAGNFNPLSTTPATNARSFTSTLSTAGTNDNASYASANTAPFISATDLHLDASSSEITNVESKGANLGVTSDIDGDSRGAIPDMGADEITIVPKQNDAGISAIPTAAFTCPGTQNVVVTLKNYGSTNLSSVKINWSVNGTAQTQYSWTGTLASGATTNVTIGSYNLTGVTNNSITAATTLPNGVTDENAANDSKTSASFQLSLSGTYTIGATASDFTTITAAVAYASSKGLCGATVFSLKDASYSAETFPITINALTGSSAINTLTIKPVSGVSPTVSGSNATSILILNGAQNIIIDGSNIANGTSRNLSISNTNTGGAAIILRNGASNNIVKNSNLLSAQTSTSVGTVTISTSTGSTGNNNNTIQNNAITQSTSFPTIGVYNTGSSTATLINTNNLIIANDISDFSYIGIYDFGYSQDATYDSNKIFCTKVTQSTSGNSLYGIYIRSVATNTIIKNNKISNLQSTSANGSIYGINLYDIAAGKSCMVYNNMISLSGGSSTSTLIGIIDQTATGTTINSYFNSIYIYGTASSTSESYAYSKAFSNASVLKNNIFVNSRLSSGTGMQYALEWYDATGPLMSDYNNLYSYGNGNNAVGADAAYFYRELTSWQTKKSQDANSISVLPNFISSTDLHIDAAKCTSLESAGTPITGIATDIDSDTRSTTTPDIGADEFTGTKPPTATANSATTCAYDDVTLTASSTTSGAGFNWYTTPFGGSAVSNGANYTISNLAATTVYYVAALNGTCESDIRTKVTVTVNPAPTKVTVVENVVSTGATSCDFDYAELTASGGVLSLNSVNALNMTFENGLNDSVSGIWTTTNTSTGGTPANAAWTERANGYLYGSTTFNSNDNSKFLMSNSDAQGGTATTATTVTELISPVFSLKNFTTASLNFYHYFRASTLDSGKVQISTDGGQSWSNTDLAAYTTTQGAATAFAAVNIDLASYVGQTNLKIKFLYNASFDWYWALDNIKISGNSTQNLVSWNLPDLSVSSGSDVPGLYTDATLLVHYKAGDLATKVYAAPETSYSYRAIADYNSCAKHADKGPYLRDKKIFTGAATDPNSWSVADNWSLKTLPTATKCVVIPSGKQAIVNIPDAKAKTVTVASGGKLTINANQSLTVTDKFTNSNTDNKVPATNPQEYYVTVKSDGNLLQVNNVTNTGDINVQRHVTDMNNVLTGPGAQMDYVYWSSPVTGQNLQQFSPGTPYNRIYQYNESNDYFYPVPLATEPTFVPGKGYAFRAEAGLPNGYEKTYMFNGVPNNGDYSFTIKRSANTGTAAAPVVHGYNLVGNPYPSNIGFDQLWNGDNNKNVIYATAWFWTNNTYQMVMNGSSYSGNNYAVYNLSGGVNATYTSTYTGPESPKGVVKVGQGFIVQSRGAENSTGTLQFRNYYGADPTNMLRVRDDGPFYQKGVTQKDRFWLKLVGADNLVNTQLIAYVPGSTPGFEKDFDGLALSMSSDLFYSKVEDKNLVIQGKGAFDINDHVKLGANFFRSSNYTISLETTEGIFAGAQDIYLKDNLNGTYTNLKQTSYTFDATKGISEGRFEIVYKPGSVLAAGGNAKEELQVYRDGDQFVVKAQSRKITTLEVLDASGRLIYSATPNHLTATFDASNISNGVYVLRIKQGAEVSTRKVVR